MTVVADFEMGGGGEWAGEAPAGGAWDLNQTDSETSHQSQTPCTV